MYRQLLVVLLLTITSQAGEVIVNTRYGLLEGTQDYFNGIQYSSFLGVPYAAPPVGDLRWRKPEPPESWTGVRKATAYGAHCHAPSYSPTFDSSNGFSEETSEDCLYLDIYIPAHLNSSSVTRYPVMVFVTGGAFRNAFGSLYNGVDLAQTGNVMVVTIHYRVGALGWMSSGSRDLPGNYGLWDTRQALIWVQENIASFGGDPSHVTLFGQSAGGVISSHLGNADEKLVDNLFQNIISISGVSSAISHGIARRAADGFLQLAANLKCSGGDMSEVLTCMRRHDGKMVSRQGEMIPGELNLGTMNVWGPVVDGDIIGKDPVASVPEGAITKYNFMLGHTRDDGAAFVLDNLNGDPGNPNDGFAKTKEGVENYFRTTFLNQFSNPDELWEAVLEHYPDLLHDDVTTREQASSRAVTDIKYTAPDFREADHYSRKLRNRGIFLYEYQYTQSFTHFPAWVQGTHMEDLWSVFGQSFRNFYLNYTLNSRRSDTDRVMMKQSQKYFTNFAHTGDPNRGPHDMAVKWPQFRHGERAYIKLSPASQVLHQDPQTQKRLEWWYTDFISMAKPCQVDTSENSSILIILVIITVASGFLLIKKLGVFQTPVIVSWVTHKED